MERKYDLLCIAGVCVDMIFSRIPFIPKAGEESYAEDFVIKGGGGANTPVAAARLGLQTALFTVIGNDPMGDMMADLLRASGVSREGILRSCAHATSVSAVMSLKGGERAFASYDKLSLNGVDLHKLEQMIANARHVHTFAGYCAALPILDLAKKHGCTVSLDTAFDNTQTLSRFAPYLSQADIFSPNEQEACQLAGTRDVYKAAERLGEYVPTLIIKLGEKGALLRINHETTVFDGVTGLEAIDTTGAGDNFIAGFLYAYLNHMPMPDCIRYANASGALSVTFAGGMDEGFTLEKVKQLLG